MTADEMEQYDVFISYSRKDTEIVYKIEEEFKKNNISYFIDREGIELGEAFARKIGTCIKNCNIVLFVWTENSNLSMYASKEISLAIHRKKTIIPFMIGSFEADDSLMFNLSDCNSIVCDEVNVSHIHNMAVKLHAQILKLKKVEDSDISLVNNNDNPNNVRNDFNSVLKVLTDTECRVSVDYEEKGIARPRQIMRIPLCAGSYCLLFESTEDKNNYIDDTDFNISAHTEKLYKVKLKDNIIKPIHDAKPIEAKHAEAKPAVHTMNLTQPEMTAREMYNEGEKYYYGRGVTKDYVKALSWYQKAADKGHADAMFSVGQCYKYGTGTKKDRKLSFEWFKKASLAGEPNAMFCLAKCFEQGIGTFKNQDTADAIYKASDIAKGGNTQLAIQKVKIAVVYSLI